MKEQQNPANGFISAAAFLSKSSKYDLLPCIIILCYSSSLSVHTEG